MKNVKNSLFIEKIKNVKSVFYILSRYVAHSLLLQFLLDDSRSSMYVQCVFDLQGSWPFPIWMGTALFKIPSGDCTDQRF